MPDKRPICIGIRKALKPTFVAMIALFVVNGAAHAQFGNMTPNPQLGMPSNGLAVGRIGIPMGSTEMPVGGLSPAPLSPILGTSPIAPNTAMPSTVLPGTAVGATGSSAAPGLGLSPTVSPPTGFGSVPPSYGITNFGTGGLQALPGSPFSGAIGYRRY